MNYNADNVITKLKEKNVLMTFCSFLKEIFHILFVLGLMVYDKVADERLSTYKSEPFIINSIFMMQQMHFS